MLGQRNDLTWGTFPIYMWASIEFFFMVVCGSAPTMKPFLDFIRRQLKLPAWSSRDRETADSRTTTDALEMNDYRRDVSKTNTWISFTPDGAGAITPSPGLGNDVTIGRTYKIRIDQMERNGDQNAFFAEESGGSSLRISANTPGNNLNEARPKALK